jgi:hypothetical protein
MNLFLFRIIHKHHFTVAQVEQYARPDWPSSDLNEVDQQWIRATAAW